MDSRVLLASAVIFSLSVPASAQVTFSYDSTRVSRINVNGADVLTGGGIYLIGSKGGVDNPSTNYSSVNSNGVVMTNSGPPFKLTFWKKSATTLGFKAEVGPVTTAIETLSLPFDFNKQRVTKFAFNGTRYYLNNSATGVAYTPGIFLSHSIIPQPFPIYQNGTLLGYTGVAVTKQPTSWGAVDGVDATVRVNVLSNSHYRSMAFFNHFGTNNLELKFGSFAVGEKATVEGEVVVTPKQQSAGWVFQAETQLSHETGRPDADGWSARVGDPVPRFLCYGPYTTAITAGNRSATYRLMLDNTTADNNRILTLDVYDAASRRVLVTRSLTRREFTLGPFKYHDFTLNFTAAAGQRLEFRTYWHGGSYCRQDLVRIK